jgi:hypothetical protein
MGAAWEPETPDTGAQAAVSADGRQSIVIVFTSVTSCSALVAMVAALLGRRKSCAVRKACQQAIPGHHDGANEFAKKLAKIF